MKSSLKDRIKKVIKSPKELPLYMMATRPQMFAWIPDKQFCKMEYYMKTGRKLNLDKPERFNEKLQWIKLNYHNPLYTKLVDKASVKEFVSNKIGKQYVIPTIDIWDRYEDIDFEKLPEQFILKCTHDSGGNIICLNKKEFNYSEARKKIDLCLKKKYYYEHREWPYKDVFPRIIAEPLLVDEPGQPLKDYKLFCFNGKVELLYVASDRGKGTTKFDFFDAEFNKIPVRQHYPNSDYNIKRPKQFEKMKWLAMKLSEDIPFVRVDFYDVKDKIYFGEMTFCNFAGIEDFYPDEYNYKFGELINLNAYKNKN